VGVGLVLGVGVGVGLVLGVADVGAGGGVVEGEDVHPATPASDRPAAAMRTDRAVSTWAA
jgi:hypothetical protein